MAPGNDLLAVSGVAVVIAGFALRLNPLLVVTVAAIVTGIAAGLGLDGGIAAFGKAFADNRFIAIPWLVLPAIGLLERGGIRERARALVAALPKATPARVLIGYLGMRQISAALGLTALGGHVQMVRPIVAPMAEAAAGPDGELDEDTSELIRSHAAAVDNVGLFFGEDVFVAVGSILLIIGFMSQYGVELTPFQLAVWAIPTALAAFLFHSLRLLRLDRGWTRRK
jgi:uncharacterized membrane protein